MPDVLLETSGKRISWVQHPTERYTLWVEYVMWANQAFERDAVEVRLMRFIYPCDWAQLNVEGPPCRICHQCHHMDTSKIRVEELRETGWCRSGQANVIQPFLTIQGSAVRDLADATNDFTTSIIGGVFAQLNDPAVTDQSSSPSTES